MNTERLAPRAANRSGNPIKLPYPSLGTTFLGYANVIQTICPEALHHSNFDEVEFAIPTEGFILSGGVCQAPK